MINTTRRFSSTYMGSRSQYSQNNTPSTINTVESCLQKIIISSHCSSVLLVLTPSNHHAFLVHRTYCRSGCICTCSLSNCLSGFFTNFRQALAAPVLEPGSTLSKMTGGGSTVKSGAGDKAVKQGAPVGAAYKAAYQAQGGNAGGSPAKGSPKNLGVNPGDLSKKLKKIQS